MQIRVSTQEHESLRLQELREHANEDQAYQDLKNLITRGLPNQKAFLHETMKQFWSVKDKLSIDDDLIVYGCRLLIPATMGKDTTTTRLVSALRDQFCRMAVPDGGPQFTSHRLAEFLHTWGVSHITPSPCYPQSNGKAEATVKSMKKMISASWTGKSVDWNKLSRALIQYRNTPCRKDGQSPAHKLFGHPVQDSIPAHCRSFGLEWQKSANEVEKAAHSTEEKAQAAYNQHAHDLTDLKVGNPVAVQNYLSNLWDIYGTINRLDHTTDTS